MHAGIWAGCWAEPGSRVPAESGGTRGDREGQKADNGPLWALLPRTLALGVSTVPGAGATALPTLPGPGGSGWLV